MIWNKIVRITAFIIATLMLLLSLALGLMRELNIIDGILNTIVITYLYYYAFKK